MYVSLSSKYDLIAYLLFRRCRILSRLRGVWVVAGADRNPSSNGGIQHVRTRCFLWSFGLLLRGRLAAGRSPLVRGCWDLFSSDLIPTIEFVKGIDYYM